MWEERLFDDIFRKIRIPFLREIGKSWQKINCALFVLMQFRSLNINLQLRLLEATLPIN